MHDVPLGSVSIWIEALKRGDEQAAEQLWNRYFHRLTLLARSRLRNATRVVDGEDVALDVLQSVLITAQRGGYPKLTNRTELWPLLVSITLRKASNELKWHFAKKRTPKVEVRDVDVTNLVSAEPGPELVAQIADQLRCLLDALEDPVLVQLAKMRLKGHTAAEIAEELDMRPRTVSRKLARIHQEWKVQGR